MLESHHWRFAISCIRESGIFDHFSADEWSQVHGVLCLLCLLLMSASQVRYLIKSLILATDITQQPKVSSRSNRSHQSNPERLPLSLEVLGSTETLPGFACDGGSDSQDVGS